MIAFQRLASRALMSLLSATVATSAVQAQTQTTAPAAAASRSRTQTADYIVAIVNQELVTAGEVQQRIDRLREEAQRSKSKLPPDDELRHQVVDALIACRSPTPASSASASTTPSSNARWPTSPRRTS
jgi:peptidyl-prolyl cis-trans isomerase SurA